MREWFSIYEYELMVQMKAKRKGERKEIDFVILRGKIYLMGLLF